MKPNISMTPVEGSSQVAALGYDPETHNLAVQFVDSPGKTYVYSDVEPATYSEMTAAESKGSFFYRNIKGKYPFDRIEDDGRVSKRANADGTKRAEPDPEPGENQERAQAEAA